MQRLCMSTQRRTDHRGCTDVARACTPTLSTQQASLNLTGFETGYADPLQSRSTRFEAGQRL